MPSWAHMTETGEVARKATSSPLFVTPHTSRTKQPPTDAESDDGSLPSLSRIFEGSSSTALATRTPSRMSKDHVDSMRSSKIRTVTPFPSPNFGQPDNSPILSTWIVNPRRDRPKTNKPGFRKGKVIYGACRIFSNRVPAETISPLKRRVACQYFIDPKRVIYPEQIRSTEARPDSQAHALQPSTEEIPPQVREQSTIAPPNFYDGIPRGPRAMVEKLISPPEISPNKEKNPEGGHAQQYLPSNRSK